MPVNRVMLVALGFGILLHLTSTWCSILLGVGEWVPLRWFLNGCSVIALYLDCVY